MRKDTAPMSDDARVLGMVQSQAPQARLLVGYVLVARVVHADGSLHSHSIVPIDLDPAVHAEIIGDAAKLLAN